MLKSRAFAVVAGVTMFGMVGCGGELDVPQEEQGLTYEQFKAKSYLDEGDVYVYNMDTPAVGPDGEVGEAGLRHVYEQFVREQAEGKVQSELAIMRSGGVDVKWSSTAKLNITYCVSSSSFGSRYSAAVNAMNSATAAWEASVNVNFVHLSQYDSNCSASQTGVVFDVRQVNSGGQYLARAFFPNDARANRNVLIDNTAFGSIAPYTLAGILRHELGHTLGFRHEHTRPEAGTCFEDNNWRALTSYDRNSVMHYPQCNGVSGRDLTLTSLDITGARSVYGSR